MKKIIQLIQQDTLRLQVLECVRLLQLPDCYVAAGFVRNLVWDYLHGKLEPTELNDVDVIYFDPDESATDEYLRYEALLKFKMKQVNWQVRNQANMHLKNRDLPYLNSLDAMGYWPEKETAVAIRKIDLHNFECVAAFGFDSLFRLEITHNPKRERSVFEKRVVGKSWLETWPRLKVV